MQWRTIFYAANFPFAQKAAFLLLQNAEKKKLPLTKLKKMICLNV
jgi:hypothetical protein